MYIDQYSSVIECIIIMSGVGHWDLFIHSSIVPLVTTSMADLAEHHRVQILDRNKHEYWRGWRGLVPGGAGYRDTGGRGGKDGRYDANLTNCSGPYYIYFNYF